MRLMRIILGVPVLIVAVALASILLAAATPFVMIYAAISDLRR